jgi:Kef-type K+ transport system membrane component KefB
VLAAILVAAKLLGELAERIGQPAVLGELVAGVLLGASVLGVVPTGGVEAELIHALAELGVALLLFEIGLETDLREMFRVGPAALAVAVVGVALPFAFGYLFWRYAPHAPSGNGDLVTAAIFIGATLTATSVGITARVLADLGHEQRFGRQLWGLLSLELWHRRFHDRAAEYRRLLQPAASETPPPRRLAAAR